MVEILKNFKIDGTPVYCEKYGSGHINETYLVQTSLARQYILQKINKYVFTNPEALIKNIAEITKHLRKKVATSREVLTLIPTTEGKDFLVDDQGEYYRIYDFISDSICWDTITDNQDFYEVGFAFGKFQNYLTDFNAAILYETIPNFHNTPERYRQFHQAFEKDVCGRAKEIQKEIEFTLSREFFASVLVDLQQAGKLPLRVTHNDTKLNNVLFDRFTKKPICVIDLDTVMPGLVAYDFGDSIRFGASTGKEDEQDLSKVSFSLPLFQAYTQGFLFGIGSSLTETEVHSLRDGAKMMTLECGIRFLTDYLNGDTYFRTHREKQNLDRARTQFKLVRDMEQNWDGMLKIIDDTSKQEGP